jgi:hypothetical protein
MRLASPTGVDLLPETPLNEILTSAESPLTFWVEAPPPPGVLVASHPPRATCPPYVQFVRRDDGSIFTPADYDEMLHMIAQDRDSIDWVRRLGFYPMALTIGRGLFSATENITVPEEVLDTYLRTFRNSTLKEFIATLQSSLPKPQNVTRTELTFTEMWENAVRKMTFRERQLIHGVIRLKVPFTVGAQIVALAEGNIERIAEMTQICVFQRNDVEIPFFVSDLKSS